MTVFTLKERPLNCSISGLSRCICTHIDTYVRVVRATYCTYVLEGPEIEKFSFLPFIVKTVIYRILRGKGKYMTRTDQYYWSVT
jgi:hypothetical protein